jgi:ATP-dependent DNA helicase RecG
LVEEHGHRYPSTAGLLLFGKAPQKFLPEAFIICTHFQGTSGRNALASQDCTGSLLNQVETALHFVKSRLTTRFDIEGTQRTQSLEIPEIALREIIINAIVHRDYQLAGPIKIAIYDHQVEIFSPGNFPGPLKTTQLETIKFLL